MYREQGHHPDDDDYAGDLRKPFNKHTVEHRARLIYTLDRGQQMAMLLNFIGARNYFVKQFPKVFRRSTNVKAAAKSGWGPVLIRLAGDDPTRQAEIERMNVYDTMRYLTERRHMQEELEKKK